MLTDRCFLAENQSEKLYWWFQNLRPFRFVEFFAGTMKQLRIEFIWQVCFYNMSFHVV